MTSESCRLMGSSRSLNPKILTWDIPVIHVSAPLQKRVGLPSSVRRGFRDLYRINLLAPIEIAPEHDPLSVRGKIHIGFEQVIMLRHVDQVFRTQGAALLRRQEPEPFLV